MAARNRNGKSYRNVMTLNRVHCRADLSRDTALLRANGAFSEAASAQVEYRLFYSAQEARIGRTLTNGSISIAHVIHGE